MPESHSDLPLRPVEFEILLCLATGVAHGYAIIQRVEERSEGRMRIQPGTLYRALQRLEDEGLVRETRAPAGVDKDDPRRRYFELTRGGRRVAGREARRLREQVAAARSAGLLGDGT